ncbi:AI-2E family transporter [Sedimentitalea nanhaiensis]|uniref:Predicted PurR-regulated permease PerM n=1 Tax=Sedimentitalea nanhaiensis TaxID=999627 RepID=A0A1I7DNB9_9RHOB|nr:AI-2E family transporter [Sedimentitalea nanhaiensis]SFU13116.1 Predicted PurR-regulated permease PerM [Sedimentitalea nanhaiensis]
MSRRQNTGTVTSRQIRSSLAYWRDVLLIATLTISGLYAGAGFLVPLALATLVFVLITAVRDRVAVMSLGGRTPPPWLGYLLGSLLVFSGLFAVVYVLGSQATQFARALSSYENQLDSALARIAGLIGADLVSFIRVNLIQIDMSRIAVSAFGGASSFFTTFLLICLYVAFMISERKAMAQKLQIITRDERQQQETSTILHAVSVSLQRYIGIKSFISAVTALFSYGVFRLLGLEFAETWAVLTFALNFIPSIGSVLAVILPSLVAIVQYDSITPFLVIVLGCGTVQFLIGNFVDPALTGKSLNISPLMVILTLTFWSAIWGIMGAFLSVPLTVCLLIVFSQIPATRPIAILLSKDGRVGPMQGHGIGAHGDKGDQ